MSGLEPVAAFALACNILQVIGVGFKTAKVCKTIYETGKQDPELQTVDEELRQILQDLDNALQAVATPVQGPMPRAAAGLQHVAMTVDLQLLVDLSSEARTTIDRLTILRTRCQSAKGSRRAALLGGLKTMFASLIGEIEKQERILRRQQEALNTGLLSRVCNQSTALQIQQGEEFRTLNSALQIFVSAISRGQTATNDLLIAEMIKSRSEITQKLDALTLQSNKDSRRQRLLQSLKFKTMNHRRNNIEAPELDTFAWIFQQHENPFYKWLISEGRQNTDGDPVFWVSGKPGSGKSTLMKHMATSPETRRLLTESSGQFPIMILSHFIWASGSPEERSFKGILCSLAYQILQVGMDRLDQNCTRLSESVINGLLGDCRHKDHPGDWSEEEIQKIILLLIKSVNTPVCVFIDGLDELESTDSTHKTFALLDTLIEKELRGCVKVCVSSRPEPAFLNRFGHCQVPSLRVQDLTKDDIRHVVRKRLLKVIGNAASGQSNDILEKVARLVCDKASGVFLWVHLALESISRGVDRSDSLENLTRRVEALPEDLERLYKEMWDKENGSDDLYRRDAAWCLNIVLDYFDDGLDVAHLPLMRLPDDALDKLLNRSKQRHHTEAYGTPDRLRITAREVETRCAGLVQISSLSSTWPWKWPGPKIDFIHRSVKEFLLNSHYGNRILKHDDTPSETRALRYLKAWLLIQSNLSGWPCFPRQSPKEFCQNVVRHILEDKFDQAAAVPLLIHASRLYYNPTREFRPDLDGNAAKLGFIDYLRHRLDSLKAASQSTRPPCGTVTCRYRNHLFQSSFSVLLLGPPESSISFKSALTGFDYADLRISFLRERRQQGRSRSRESNDLLENTECRERGPLSIDLILEFGTSIHVKTIDRLGRLGAGAPAWSLELLGSPLMLAMRTCIHAAPRLLDIKSHDERSLLFSQMCRTLQSLIDLGADLDERTIVKFAWFDRQNPNDFDRSSSSGAAIKKVDYGREARLFLFFEEEYQVRRTGEKDQLGDYALVEVNTSFLLGHFLGMLRRSNVAPIEADDNFLQAFKATRRSIPQFISAIAYIEYQVTPGRSPLMGSPAPPEILWAAVCSSSEGEALTRAVLQAFRDKGVDDIFQPHSIPGPRCEEFPDVAKHIKCHRMSLRQLITELSLVERDICAWDDDPICTIPNPFPEEPGSS